MSHANKWFYIKRYMLDIFPHEIRGCMVVEDPEQPSVENRYQPFLSRPLALGTQSLSGVKDVFVWEF